GNNIIIANSVNLAGHVEIADNAILEGLVAVQQFVKIGAHSFVTGSSLVRKNVPPFIKVAREPLQFVGVNTVGLRRRGFSDELIKQIEDIYRILFVRGYNVSNALEIIEQEIPASTDRDHILQFIRSSEDGIVRGISK
ncbi:MAG TPA: acyl-[acyl-carrier-protein]--UDP-N-acetylglucosamine O-acyltransferase, partial [Bacteroidia bacterium]|nr:acyl-[acyl-carrier-protein]--UDP-N-acetylglucosamine O-acyltransferase [Bacteroidia bacterium]